MTKDEARSVLRILKTAWPNSFRVTEAEAKDILELWAVMFVDDDYELVCAAVKSIIATDEREFAPTIGRVKEQMRKLIATEDVSESKDWERIHRAIHNSLYDSEAEFEALPARLKKVVGSPSQLRDWARMDSEVVNSVVASNVQRALRTVYAREAEKEKLPQDVQESVREIAERLSLEAKPSEPKMHQLVPLKHP